MKKIWFANGEFEIETASNNTVKLLILNSAQKLGIFQALSEKRTVSELKQMLNINERALFIILEALVSMGYVNKRFDEYIITDNTKNLFLKKGDNYVGGFLPHFINIMDSFIKLPEIIKNKEFNKEKRNIADFMDAMASKSDKTIEKVINYCLKKKKDARTVLDLGGGPGKYSKAFINKGLNVVLFDVPEVIDYVSDKFGLKDIKGLTLKKGDFTKENLFDGEFYDIVFMGNITHIYSENENKKLIKKVSNILRNNGMIAIEDFVRGKSPIADIFAVNMLANTESGNTYNEKQYTNWLKYAGFKDIEFFDIDEKNSQIITGFKK